MIIIYIIIGFYGTLLLSAFLGHAINTHIEDRNTQFEESKHGQESDKY